MDRSVAQGGPPDPDNRPWPDPGTARWIAILVGLMLALAAMAIYLATRTDRYYDHFVWQAAAFLEGHAAIRYPVEASGTLPGNAFFQDVLPVATTDGVPRGLLPFPPLPAIVLLPFVALWGLATDAQTIFTILAAVDVAICWWALGSLRIRPVVRLGTTIFFAVGTVFWYTAQVATTWYQAHIVAVGLSLLAIGIALRGDPAPELAARPGGRDGVRRPVARGRSAGAVRPWTWPRPPAGSTAVRGRAAVRAGVHRAPDGRVRGALLRVRRLGWRLATARLVGRRRRGAADRAARGLQRADHRPRLPSCL